MMRVYVHQCVYNLAAIGKGNCEIQKAVTKCKKLVEETNASLPRCPCAHGHSGIQLWFTVVMEYTKTHPRGLPYLVGLLVMGWKHAHIRYSLWSGPLPAKCPSYWQLLSINLQGFWKQQEREMGLIQNQNMSRHWNPLALFLLDSAACLCGISH